MLQQPTVPTSSWLRLSQNLHLHAIGCTTDCYWWWRRCFLIDDDVDDDDEAVCLQARIPLITFIATQYLNITACTGGCDDADNDTVDDDA